MAFRLALYPKGRLHLRDSEYRAMSSGNTLGTLFYAVRCLTSLTSHFRASGYKEQCNFHVLGEVSCHDW